MLKNSVFRAYWRYVNFFKSKSYSTGAYDNNNNLRKIKLAKKLASTVLFGGTLVFALWYRKRRVSESFKESSLIGKNELYRSNLTMYSYKGFILPSFVMKKMDDLKKFECRDDDIFVISFPKTGTTWLQEIIYCIMHDADFETSAAKNIEDKFPYLEFIYPGLATIEKQVGQRFIKTHLPFSLLPASVHEKKPKILCIIRNPKDVTVSYYHFLRMFTMSSYIGNFEQFVHDMVSDKVPFGPMWKHYADIWQHKDDENVLILFYEDLHKDIRGSIERIAAFLGKTLQNDEVLQIAHHCQFSQMAHNPSVNYDYWDDLGMRHKHESKFMRKGQVGDWKNYFTTELNNQIDKWIDENMKTFDSCFTYDLFSEKAMKNM